MRSDSLAELLRQLCEQVFTAKVTPRLSDLVAQHFGEGKMLNRATMSAKASWKASTSRLLGSLKRRCMPSSKAWVVSWATISCERQVKTVPPG